MNVLVGCEYSGRVRDAFAAKGHNAWSCDLMKSSGNHFQFGIFVAIDGPEAMEATGGNGWDIIIIHPPCTHLCVSSNGTYGKGKAKYHKRLSSIQWTRTLWNFTKSKAKVGAAMENPIGVLSDEIDKPSQIIHPHQFGHPEQKKTCLWLDRLPNLIPTNDVYLKMIFLPKKEQQKIWYMSPGENRGRERSLTYQGIADAMADQWGNIG